MATLFLGTVWRLGPLCLAFLLLLPVGQAGAAEDRPIVFVGDRDYPPYEFREDGRTVGASADLAKAIGDVLERPVELRLMKWSEAQKSVLDGTSDILTVFGKNEQREALYDFSEPTFEISFSLFVRSRDVGGFDPRQLSGRRIGITRGGWPRAYVESNHPSAVAVFIDNYEDGFHRLLRGSVDAVIANTWTGYFILREIGISSIVAAPEPLKRVIARMAVRKGNQELLTQIDEALVRLKATGEFDRIIDKWSGRQVVLVEQRQVWGIYGAAALALVALSFLILALYFGRSKRIALAREITERKQAEGALRNSEAMLAASQQIGSLGSWEWNATTDEGVWSDETYRIFRLTPDSPCPSFARLLEMVHPEDRDAVMKSVEEAVANRRPYEFEYRVIRADGACRTCYSKAELILDDAGGVTGMAGIIQDITERKRAEEALRESETKFRAMAASSLDALIAMGDDGRIAFWNSAAERMFGHAQDEAMGAELHALIVPPRYRKKFSKGFRRFIKTGKGSMIDTVIEIEGLRKDGEEFPVELSLSASKLDGHWTAFAAIRDITDRKQREAALRESEAQLRAVFDNTPVCLNLKDTEGRYLLINKPYEEWLGHAAEEILGRKASEILETDRAERFTAAERTVMETGEAIESEIRVPRPDGNIHHRIVIKFPVKLPDDSISAIGTVAVDITERKRAEEALRESEARFRDIAEAASDWFWEMGPDLRFTYHSDRYFEFTGFRPEDKIGTTRARYVDPSHFERDTAKWAAHFADLAARRRFRNFEYAFKLKDGSICHARISGQPVFDAEGEFEGYRGTGTDITEQRLIEAQLREAQKLEALGQLTGGVAHEFNNLLQAIVGGLDIINVIMDEVHDGDAVHDADRLKRMIELVQRSAFIGRDLTERLLSYAGKQQVRPEVVDVGEFVSDSVDLLVPMLGETIEIEIEIADDLWPIKVDREQLETAVLNLALNARDAMANGGRLMIEAANAHIDEALAAKRPDAVIPGDYVELAVTDTGIGMSPEVKDQAFDPFFTTKDVGKGTGLGLSMVYGFVRRQSGGFVDITSEGGRGTTVALYLPRAEAKKAEASQPAEGTKEPSSGGETILVVEDNPAVLDSMALMLEGLGYTALKTKDAAEALSVLGQVGDIDLLLVDVILPGGTSGIELTETAQRAYPATKVILMSGYSEAQLAADGLVEGGIRLLKKPFRQKELASTLEEALGSGWKQGA